MGNRYLEKIAEFTSREQKALDRGYDRPTVQAGIHAIPGMIVGGVAGAALAAKGHKPHIDHDLAKILGAKYGAIAGGAVGATAGLAKGLHNNHILEEIRKKDSKAVDDTVIRDGKKSYIAGYAFSPWGVGVIDTYKHNSRYNALVSRLAREKKDQ